MPPAVKAGSSAPAVLAILQARMSSSRLPGKVLKPLLGEPMLARQIERVQRCRRVDRILVATSSHPEDDAIAVLCEGIGVHCFRGSLTDVLDRFYQAARLFNPRYVVRLTGDCPLADPELIDEVIRYCVEGKYDYTSNALQPTFPDGLDAEIFLYDCLAQAWREARLASEREHVTPFIYNHPSRFRVGSFTNNVDYSHLRWTVDEPEDFDLVERVYASLYPANPAFSSRDILDLLERNPGMARNASIKRNEGYEKSLRMDTEPSPMEKR